MAGFSFVLLKPFFNHRLGRNSSVIGAWHPKCIEALHAFHTDQDILKGVVQGMPEMQSAGNIGRGDDDGERLSFRVGGGVKISALFPHTEDASLRVSKVESLWNIISSERKWLGFHSVLGPDYA